MKIEVNISKGNMFVLVGMFILLAGIVGVYAVVSHNASDLFLSDGKSVQVAIDDLYQDRVFEQGAITVLQSETEVHANSRVLVPVKEIIVGQGGNINLSWAVGAQYTSSSYTTFSLVEVDGVAQGVEADCQSSSTTFVPCSRIITVQPGSHIVLKARGENYYAGTPTSLERGYGRVKDFKVLISRPIPTIVFG